MGRECHGHVNQDSISRYGPFSSDECHRLGLKLVYCGATSLLNAESHRIAPDRVVFKW
jgi:endogenous inhibitor of DNA gyrase (YacG/DUF329 family)